MPDIYDGVSEIAGPLHAKKTVSFKKLLSHRERATLALFFVLICLTSASLMWFIIGTFASTALSIVLIVGVILILLSEIIRFTQSLTLLVFAKHAKDPIPMHPGRGLRIAILTTIVPSKEPFDLVEKSLKAMKEIDTAGNSVDVWLLDEGDDYMVRSKTFALDVKHFSRKGIEKWNTESGEFKAKTKHGNHNAWRSAHENDYDVVAVFDPDHVPTKDFLIRTLGYFKDPDVAFVVAPQVYGNIADNWIANASASQAYIFNGIIQRGGNGMNAPLLTGTNHLYRVAAMNQIGGYQDSIIEDHLTGLIMYGANKDADTKWKGVYTPDILAVGEGPSSYTDYFNQQRRWSYGIWDIARKHTPGAIKHLGKGQALFFLMLQFFYPSVAVAWVASSIATILLSSLTASLQDLGPILMGLWAYSCISTIVFYMWLRKFNLAPHERKDFGGGGLILSLMTIPIYVSAGWQAITRKPLTFAVTAKGDMTSPDTLLSFSPHLYWIVLNAVALSLMLNFSNSNFGSNVFWTIEHIVICAVPILLFTAAQIRRVPLQRAGRRFTRTIKGIRKIPVKA